MWKHVLPPVVLVIVFWITLSFATSIYLWYADRAFQRVLVENVSSIEAAADLQVACWRLVAARPNDAENAIELDQRSDPFQDSFIKALRRMQDAAMSSYEVQIVVQIESQIDAIRGVLDTIEEKLSVPESEALPMSSGALEKAAQNVTNLALQIRAYNQELITAEEVKRKQLLSRVMWSRSLGLIFGPFVGIILGWKITSQLQRRVSTLAITLRKAASDNVFQVGEFSLRGADDLKGVQQLSEKVIEEMCRIDGELQRAEQEVIQSERLAAVGELSAGVAHELRNPLTSIKLLLQHAASNKDKGLIEIKNLNLILSEIARMEETIQGLLDFSRPANLHCRIHDIHIPLRRAITLIKGRAIASRVEIAFQPEINPVLINADIEQIHLVFVNLLINAVESIELGGKIDVELTKSDAKNQLCIEFRDTGRGIAPEVLQQLFKPFVTTKEKGTGLGLALCHRIVTKHNGSISARNQSQGGSIFAVQLPLAAAVHIQNQGA